MGLLDLVNPSTAVLCDLGTTFEPQFPHVNKEEVGLGDI